MKSQFKNPVFYMEFGELIFLNDVKMQDDKNTQTILKNKCKEGIYTKI